MATFDISRVRGNDRVVAGGAAVLLVLSFFSWYTVKAPSLAGFGGTAASGNLWDTYGWLKVALLLAVAAGALVVARLAGALDDVQLPVGVHLLTLALSGAATALFVLRLLGSFHSVSFGGYTVSAHPAFGWYLGIVVSAVMTAFAYLSYQASGEQLPSAPPA